MPARIPELIKLGIKRTKRRYDHSVGLFTSQVPRPATLTSRSTYERFAVADPHETLRSPATEITSPWGGMTPTVCNYDATAVQIAPTDDLKILRGCPQTELYTETFYIPQYGCLYTQDGLRIDRTCLFQGRGRSQRITVAPERIKPAVKTPIVPQTLVFGGAFHEHYGHFLCESIARLWYAAKDQRLPILCRGLSERKAWKPTFLDAFFAAMPIDRRRFISFDGTVLCREVIVPHPSFTIRCEGFEVHKILPENVAERLLHQEHDRTSQPLYFSRSKLNRRLRHVVNETVLEQELIKRGVAICHPELVTLSEQIRLVNRHELIIGSLGSALHSVLFDVSSSRNLVCLGSKEKFVNTNYLMIDAIKSVNSVYVGALERDPSCDETAWWSQNRLVDVGLVVSVLQDVGVL